MTAAANKMQTAEALLADLTQMKEGIERKIVKKMDEVIKTGDTDTAVGALYQMGQVMGPNTSEDAITKGAIQLLAVTAFNGRVAALEDLSPLAFATKPELLVIAMLEARKKAGDLLKDFDQNDAQGSLRKFAQPTPEERSQITRLMVGMPGFKSVERCINKLRSFSHENGTWCGIKMDDAQRSIFIMLTTAAMNSILVVLEKDFVLMGNLAEKDLAAERATEKRKAAQTKPAAAKAPSPVQPVIAAKPRVTPAPSLFKHPILWVQHRWRAR